jgi:hypothetical protein
LLAVSTQLQKSGRLANGGRVLFFTKSVELLSFSGMGFMIYVKIKPAFRTNKSPRVALLLSTVLSKLVLADDTSSFEIPIVHHINNVSAICNEISNR